MTTYQNQPRVLSMDAVAVQSLLYRNAAGAVAGFIGSQAGSLPTWNSGLLVDSYRAGANGEQTPPPAAAVFGSSSPATSGADEDSFSARWIGAGWKTNAEAGSVVTQAAMYLRSNQGAANPTAQINIAFKIGAGGWANAFNLFSTGQFTGTIVQANSSLMVSGDAGSGTASSLKFTNATIAAGVATATFGNLPAGYVTTPTWLKAYSGTASGILPFFAVA